MAGMNRLDIRVTQKIRLIQCQDVSQSIGLHDRSKTRIMHLNAAHMMGHHEPPPYQIDFLIVGQERHRSFDSVNALVGIGDGEAIAVSLCRPGTDIPEFGDVLQRVTSFYSTPAQLIESCPDKPVLRIVLPEHPQKNIGIDQIHRRRRYQSWS